MNNQPHLNSNNQQLAGYAWLEQARKIFAQGEIHVKREVLSQIINEGQSRIESESGEDIFHNCYLHLVVAEAQMNRALEQEEEEQYRDDFQAGYRSCKQAAEQALAGNTGMICTILPRVLTLFSAFYQAAPDLRSDGLINDLQKYASQLDSSLVEQKALREAALQRLDNARLLLAEYVNLSLADKKAILTHAANLMLEAGDCYLEAGDFKALNHVKSDLKEIQTSLNNPDHPFPQLELFSIPVAKKDLIPPIEIHKEQAQVKVTADEQIPNTPRTRPAATQQPKRRSPLVWIFSIVGLIVSCLTTTCGGVSLIYGLSNSNDDIQEISLSSTQTVIAITRAFLSNPLASEQDIRNSATPPSPTIAVSATPSQTSTPTEEIMPSATNTSEIAITGNQYLDENSFYDDFSSDALGWLVYDDGVTIAKYEEDAYSLQVKQQDTFDWVYLPVDFIPYEVNLDVRGTQGPQDGTFGVLCHLQDVNNYYYIEIDLFTSSYTIAQIRAGEYVPLTRQNENGQYWWETDQLTSPPTATNRIGVSCYLDNIGLFINNEFVDSVTITQPFEQVGQTGLFVYAFEFAGEEGYKVYFDNVEAFQPVQ